jgi:cytochrome c oxidase subunit III
MTDAPVVVDVSELPRHTFGLRDTVSWGTVVMVAVEGTGTMLLLAVYFYLRAHADVWPPVPPGHAATVWAIAAAAVLALSNAPVYACGRAAARYDVRRARLWLVLAVVLGFAFLVLRLAELLALDFRWDSSGHGSIFWVLQGFHGALASVEVIESVLFAVLLFVGPVQAKKLSHIESDAGFWTFVVVSGVGQTLLLYLDGWGLLP